MVAFWPIVGVSSMQLDESSRGFSFMRDGPLDMRMDVNNSSSATAHDLVNTLKETDLANIIYQYGEEPRSRLIARQIVKNRPIETTLALAKVIESVVRRGHHRRGQRKSKPNVHPATRTFQALKNCR